MAKYAATTTVSVEKSKIEIEQALRRYGADQFVSGWEPTRAMIGFRAKNRMVRFMIDLPHEKSYRWEWNATAEKKEKRIEQDTRQRFRALLLVVRAKLESVESGISTFEQEFMAHIVLPNNLTVGEVMLPQIAKAYETGTMPRLLGDGTQGN